MDKSNPITKVPFVLITGFLGSGKTSLLKQILHQIGGKKRVAIVQNEFAPGKTDAAELENLDHDYHVLNVNKGSVFCVCQLDSFVNQLDVFLDRFQPELIFLEATGLADPISIGQILEAEQVVKKLYLSTIWTVIDAHNFSNKLQFIQRVRHQIQIADTLIINKWDITNLTSKDMDLLDSWNPGAQKVKAKFGAFTELEVLIDQVLAGHIKPNSKIPEGLQNSAGRPDIGTCVIRTQKVIPETAIEAFWQKNKSSILRMKGFIRVNEKEYCMVHSIFDQLSIEKITFWTGVSELIVIGPGISGRWVMNELIKQQ